MAERQPKPSWAEYGWRVGKSSAIYEVNHGRGYPVHAAKVGDSDGTFITACGLTLRMATELDSPSTYTSCENCLRRLPK